MNWRIVVISVIGCCLLLVGGGGYRWQQQKNDLTAQAALQLEASPLPLEDWREKNKQIAALTANKTSFSSIEETFVLELADLLQNYQETLHELLAAAKEAYAAEAVQGNPYLTIEAYTEEANDVTREVDHDFALLYERFLADLAEAGYREDDGALYYLLYEDRIAETKTQFVLELISLSY